jgi:hypothetical protein
MTGIVIQSDSDRAFLHRMIDTVQVGTEVIMGPARRTDAQSMKMRAMLTDVAKQKDHKGRYYNQDQWKILFMHALGQEVEFMPSLDGSTFIPYGGDSSEMKIGEMSDLITFIESWGMQNGVVFKDGAE